MQHNFRQATSNSISVPSLSWCRSLCLETASQLDKYRWLTKIIADNKKSKVIGVTESSKLLLEDWIITIGVSEIPINKIILHDKLVREGLAKSQNCSFARVGHLCGASLCNMFTSHFLLAPSKKMLYETLLTCKKQESDYLIYTVQVCN